MKRRSGLLLILFLVPLALYSQEKTLTPGGFVRGGIFLSAGDYEHDVNAAYGDAALTLTATDNLSFKGFADVRVRLGQQFGENVNSFTLREAWGMYYNKYMSISAGQKIIKWGKTDKAFGSSSSVLESVSFDYQTDTIAFEYAGGTA